MKKSDYENYFKGKKITVMGLGLLGRGVQVAQFLAECGAILTVTDLKSKKELASSLKKLAKYKIRYVLGKHEMKDFENIDMVVKAAGVPLDSPYILHAKKLGIEIAMDASLFAKLATNVTIVGVTGTRGKSMTTMLIYEILKHNEKSLKHKVYLGGNIRGYATLPLLAKVQKGDIVVLELDSWQLQGFGDEKISPHIAVFTSFMQDHMNYYRGMKEYFADKTNIFRFQTRRDILVIRPAMQKLITKSDVYGKLFVAKAKDVPGYPFSIPGVHQQENLSCAVLVARKLGVSIAQIKSALKNFKGVEGRLQYLTTVRGVKVYNDNNATTPEATMAGIEALAIGGKKIVLIAGGNDKGLPVGNLEKVMKRYCKDVILIPGSGTQKLSKSFLRVKNLKEAVKKAFEKAKKGDIILFSPAFSSFAQYANEYERNDEFVTLIKQWKKKF